MIIHSKIRQSVLELLKANVSNVTSWYNGRLSFLNFEDDAPAISVFIDEVVGEPITTCFSSMNAELTVQVYLKAGNEAQNKLDEYAQQIHDAIIRQWQDLGPIKELYFNRFGYDQDSQQATWHTANITFQITYENEELSNE